jgi:hypothetical protein
MLAELGEEFLQAGVELALGAIAVEAEGNVTRRRHSLVYDRRKESVSGRVDARGGVDTL